MNVLDLFSGIGGFSLGLERAGMTTVAFCEVDPWCRKVLAKHWPDVPCHDDVRTLKGEDVGAIDLICGGYPCTPFSQAGKRRGAEDDRYLWPEMFRIIKDIRPAWVIGENVAGHISMGLDDVLSDLEGEGFAVQPFVIPAVAVGAPHRRDRVWIVANDQSVGRGARRAGRSDTGSAGQREQAFQAMANAAVPGGETSGGHGVGVGHGSCGDKEQLEGSRRQEHVADASKPGLSQSEQDVICGEGRRDEGRAVAEFCRWPVEPDVGRVAHGIPKRVDRLKGLGNAVVPQIPEMIGRAIMAVRP